MLINQTKVQIHHEKQFNEILTPQAMEFLEKLHHHFEERRKNLLEIRQQIQKKLNGGDICNFFQRQNMFGKEVGQLTSSREICGIEGLK